MAGEPINQEWLIESGQISSESLVLMKADQQKAEQAFQRQHAQYCLARTAEFLITYCLFGYSRQSLMNFAKWKV